MLGETEKLGTSCFSRIMSGLPSELKHLTGKEEVGLSRRSAASFWALLRSLPLITKTFSLRIPWQKPGRLPKGGRQGGLEESVVIFPGQSGGLTDSSTSPNSLGGSGDCGATTTALSYHNSLFLLPHPTRTALK